MKTKVLAFLSCVLVSFSLCGVAYSHWQDEAKIQGKVKMTCWKACVRIRKTLEGAFIDPITGEPVEEPTNLIAIAADFPTRFKLAICVKNCGSTELKDMVVTDVIKNNIAPREWYPEDGVSWKNYAPGGKDWDGIHYGFNELTWNIGTLSPGEQRCLTIRIETLQNMNGKYEPTSGDEGDSQELEKNEGATVKAKSPFSSLSATTEGIIVIIGDDGIPENGLGIIESPELPYSTPWAEDRYP